MTWFADQVTEAGAEQIAPFDADELRSCQFAGETNKYGTLDVPT